MAFKTVKLGQVAQARGALDEAGARYTAGLQRFQQLGMPRESQQVQAMLDSLSGSASANPLNQFPQVRDNLINQTANAIVALRRGDLPPQQAQAAATQVAEIATHLAQDDDFPADQRRDLATFLQAAAQVLQGQPWSAVPEAYADVVAQIENLTT